MFGRRTLPPKPIPNSFWIEPGRILAGEYPGGHSEEETRLRLEAFLKAGISAYVNLTQPGEMPPYDVELPLTLPDGRRILHLQKPLEDHGLPESPAQLDEILFELDRLLDRGDLVYVHCRAGIGRTNLVLGCWMRRHGMGGTAAIKRLNKLWKSNARSASWPRIPEPHQERYVLDWNLPQDAPAPSAPRALAAATPKITLPGRYLGALLGLACGDAMGTSVRERASSRLGPLADLPGGAWGDDTSMTLCVATSLVKLNGFDALDQMKRLVDWQRTGAFSSTGRALGLTPAVAKAIATYKWSGNTFSGSHDPARWEPESVSRVGAIVLYAAATPASVFEWAADSSRLTHQSPGILDACRYYAALLLAILRGTPKSALMAEAGRLLQQYYGKPLKAPVQRLADLTEFPVGDPPPAVGAVAGVLHRVLQTLAETSNFRDGVVKICNRGGPADVYGALFGQLAGALYGVDAVPVPWREILLQRPLLEGTAERLLEAAAQREE